MQAAQAADIAEWLPNDLLTKLDRCLMAHGVEGRTPLLDPAIDADDVRTRRLIVAIAVDIAKRLGNEASRSWADGGRSSDLHPGFVSR